MRQSIHISTEAIQKTSEYILKFILKGNYKSEIVSYSKSPQDTPVTIIASDFFDDEVYGTKESLPHSNIFWDDLPVFYGQSKITKMNGKIIIYADIVATTYFFLSRYEDLDISNVKRDIYGRPIGKESIVASLGVLDCPIIDMYSEKLIGILFEMQLIKKPFRESINMVYLTHDIDLPWLTRGILQGIKVFLRELLQYKRFTIKPLLYSLGFRNGNNIYDTFDWLLSQDGRLKREIGEKCQDYYFVICNETHTSMTRKYWKDIQMESLLDKLRSAGALIGIHTSYECGCGKERITTELDNYKQLTGDICKSNRNHYLISNKPEWFVLLENNGIEDDFTVAYADCNGFRLGTCRSARFINPFSGEISGLILHPLTVMEATLTNTGYMNLSREKCKEEVKKMIETVDHYGGDFCFLLHNSTIAEGAFMWWKEEYRNIIDILIKTFSENNDEQ